MSRQRFDSGQVVFVRGGGARRWSDEVFKYDGAGNDPVNGGFQLVLRRRAVRYASRPVRRDGGAKAGRGCKQGLETGVYKLNVH